LVTSRCEVVLAGNHERFVVERAFEALRGQRCRPGPPRARAERELDAERFVPNARLAGATPMWEGLGDEPGTVFSY
jgi:hypothetical protein